MLALLLGFVVVAFLLLASNDNDAGGFALFKVYADFVQILVVIMGASRMASVRLDISALDFSSLLGDEEFPCLVPLTPFSSAFFSLGWTTVLILQVLLALLLEGLFRKSHLVKESMGGWGAFFFPCSADDGRIDEVVQSRTGEVPMERASQISDDALFALNFDVRTKSVKHSHSHIRALYAQHGVRQCSFWCFVCCGDSCLPDTIEVEKSAREM